MSIPAMPEPVVRSGEIAHDLEQDGYAIVNDCLSEETCVAIASEFLDGAYGMRELLTMPSIRSLAVSPTLFSLVERALGQSAFAVSGTFFNKTPDANWKVPWHQDRMIKVKSRFEMSGWGPWSVKGGVVHVQPPACIMSRVIAVRLHLDDCPEENGALRVIPGSHKEGFIDPNRTEYWTSRSEAVCAVPQGGALLMSPLILHTSSPSIVPRSRRVIHLEFACEDLPHPIEWQYRIA